MKEPTIGAERLAALLDGRLDPREREEALAHVASSDDDYAVVADAAAVLRDLEEAEEDAPAPASPAPGPAAAPEPATEGVIPIRSAARPRGWRAPGARWAALAAVLAALALVPVLRGRMGAGDPGDPERLVELLAARDAGLPAGWMEASRPWGGTRGAEEVRAEGVRAARLGALLVDLEIAVRARDADATSRLAAQVRHLLDDVSASGPAAAIYDEIGKSAGAAPETLDARLREGHEMLAGLLGEEARARMALGAWAEAARLAVANRDAAFFRTRETRRALERAAEATAADEPARAAVERVRAAAETEGTPDWGALETGLTELFRAVAR